MVLCFVLVTVDKCCRSNTFAKVNINLFIWGLLGLHKLLSEMSNKHSKKEGLTRLSKIDSNKL